MPLYEYSCQSCDERFEVLQRLGAVTLPGGPELPQLRPGEAVTRGVFLFERRRISDLRLRATRRFHLRLASRRPVRPSGPTLPAGHVARHGDAAAEFVRVVLRRVCLEVIENLEPAARVVEVDVILLVEPGEVVHAQPYPGVRRRRDASAISRLLSPST